jgi:alkanesulfonate monooxygenase SsuD/methylene tetrahydromethanopterin reductase-like flavin-dependent oxidoreductase (luciferase family)
MTLRALRRDRIEREEDFPRDVAELQHLLAPAAPGQQLIAMPGAGTRVPIWLLGSSLFSARLAAARGCLTPLRHISRHVSCCRQSTSIAGSFKPPTRSPSPT